MTRRILVRFGSILLAGLLLSSALLLTGCNGMSDEDFLEMAKEKLLEYLEQQSEDAENPESGPVQLALTFPVGRSPKVFVSGWVFGATCTATDKEGDTVDLADQVKWSGSGSFEPETGTRVRPTFDGPGGNTITLSVVYQGKTYKRTFNIEAVSTAGYARVGDLAKCTADNHGSPADPVPVQGPIISGSPNVFIDGKPAARKGDRGVHAGCAGPNTFEITGGPHRTHQRTPGCQDRRRDTPLRRSRPDHHEQLRRVASGETDPRSRCRTGQGQSPAAARRHGDGNRALLRCLRRLGYAVRPEPRVLGLGVHP
ncbi:MAG: PAAR domain-containing protein [Actinomycetota bacterium]|nr:PAAR domain-containing protein [Actinomycetota bacterium]